MGESTDEPGPEGRPHINVKVEEALLTELDRVALKLDRTRSWVVRRALEYGVEMVERFETPRSRKTG